MRQRPFTPRGQESAYKTYNANAYFWGLMLDPQVLPADCQGQGINDVFVHRNFGQDFASVVTLGIWMPAEISSAPIPSPVRRSHTPNQKSPTRLPRTTAPEPELHPRVPPGCPPSRILLRRSSRRSA